MRQIFLLTALATSSSAFADYSTQMNLGYQYLKDDSSSFVEITETSLLISTDYYFDGVSTANIPLYEAAFLSKSSMIGAGIKRDELDVDYSNWDNTSETYNNYSLRGYGVVNNIVIGASRETWYEDIAWTSIDFGYYVTDTQAIYGSLGTIDPDDDSSETTLEIGYHGVFANRVALDGSYMIIGDNIDADILGASATYFFTNHFGAGL